MRVLAAEQEVPLHALAGVGVGFDAARGQVAVEEEGQGEGEDLGLAGAVVAAQQQAAVLEVELLGVVEEEVHQSGAQRLPAGPAGAGQIGHGSDGGRRRMAGGGESGGHRCVVLGWVVLGWAVLGRGVFPGSSTTVSPTA